ncbi:MAG: electron transfer flavoprotein subunit beta/FixA family protein [Candidatus Subteraquimicrobiales bacterium]|nr:electron transfer flavoprotein subunit beta/FixA family protein [Candidatus Subteraquimicrobiales bacterium]
MDIIVCIKQVPKTTEVKIDLETNTLVRQGVEGIINPFDTYAIEEGVRLKERFGGKVTVITMGPPQAEQALREAISVGADEAILLSDRAFAGADTLATSYTLAKAIQKIGFFDLIVCGKQTMDGDTAQVGPELAHFLDISYVAYVKKVEEIKDSKITVERMIEEGYEVIEISLPGLITVVKEINEPRLPSLKGLMRAKSAPVTIWNHQDIKADENKIGLFGSPTQVVKIFVPEKHKKGEILEGELNSSVETLINRLKQGGLI